MESSIAGSAAGGAVFRTAELAQGHTIRANTLVGCAGLPGTCADVLEMPGGVADGTTFTVFGAWFKWGSIGAGTCVSDAIGTVEMEKVIAAGATGFVVSTTIRSN